MALSIFLPPLNDPMHRDSSCSAQNLAAKKAPRWNWALSLGLGRPADVRNGSIKRKSYRENVSIGSPQWPDTSRRHRLFRVGPLPNSRADSDRMADLGNVRVTQ